MFTGIEGDQEGRYDQGTINKVPGELDTERGGQFDQNLTEECMTEIYPVRLSLRAV